MAIFRFFKMAAAAILDLQNFKFLTLGTDKRVELHHRAKFRQNRSYRGRDMAVFRFREFGLKTPIHAPKLGGFGFFDPLNGEQCERFPKRHILTRVRVV